MRASLIRQAEAELDEERSWTCATCTTMTDDDGPYCRHCASYWADVENGLYEEPFYADL